MFEGDGLVSEYIGGYDDWQKERAAKAAKVAAAEELVKREAREAAAKSVAEAAPTTVERTVD